MRTLEALLGGELVKGDVVARPKPIRWRSLGAGGSGWLVCSGAFLARFRGSGLAVVGGLEVVLLLAIGYLLLVVQPRQYVAVTGHELRVKGLTRARTFRRSELSKVVQLKIRMSGAAGRPVTPAWLVVDRSGAVVVKLNQRAWDIDQLDGVRQRLGLPIEQIQGERDARVVNESLPGALYWWTVHPAKSGALLAATIIGLALLIHFAAR